MYSALNVAQSLKLKFIKSQKGGENPLGKAFEAAKIAEQITQAK